MEVTATRDWHYLKLYIDGILYVIVPMENFDGLQSWMDDGKYFIEFYQKGGTIILLEFMDIEKWKKILAEIDKKMPSK